MGKLAVFATLGIVATTMIVLLNTQEQTRETDARENEKRSMEIARELAMVGRKLVLTNWMQTNGVAGVQPADILRGGGRIRVTSWNPTTDTLDFTIQADFDSTVHEVRSRYAWTNFGLNPVQLKVPKVDPDISPTAILDFTSIALDDQSLADLDTVLVSDLGLIGDLSEYGLGLQETHDALEAELDASGNPDFINLADNLLMITETERTQYDLEEGLFYPDQISEAVSLYAAAHPTEHQVATDVGDLGATFGIDDGYSMLTFEGDMVLSADITGHGVLVVEGDLVVPSGVTFNWEGVIVIKPPQATMNPVIDLSGFVNIEGAIVALQEGLPNTGHMDLSVYRDMSGAWPVPEGADIQDQEILEHTHDFTSLKGNRVVFHSDDVGEPDHQSEARFDETTGMASFGDSIYFEIFNNAQHGRGLINVDRTTGDPVFQTAGNGFDDIIADPGNEYRTIAFPAAELEHFDIAITRLSSLQKMWDTGDPYPGCTHPTNPQDGPRCVWSAFNRYNALSLRMYLRNADTATDKKVYEASLYWHRRLDEEDEFEDEMADLAAAIQSPDYGLDLIVGPDATIVGEPGVLLGLGAFSGMGLNFGVTNLGTWHRQWNAHDAGNPLYQIQAD